MKYELHNSECVEWLTEFRKPIPMIFADPPDNIGLGYDSYKDKLPDHEYVCLLSGWLSFFCDIADTVWISFNSRWLLDLAETALTIRNNGWEFKPCVQTFSFYQHCKTDLGNAHRPLWLFRKPGAPLYPQQAKIPSWRQQHGDSRATAGGKVPGDVFDFTKLPEKQRRNWHERAIQCGEWVVDSLIPDDHFDFTRVVGNSRQRRVWHPTQLNEGLVERCMLLSTKESDLVVDPFAGTGTTMRVCKKFHRPCTLIELDNGYCEKIAMEHEMSSQGTGSWDLQYSEG